MNRLRTLLTLAGIMLMTAVVGSAGMTGARAEDFQAQGSHLNDPANARNLNDQQDPKTSRLNDQQDPKTSRLNDSADRRDPADAHNVDDKANKRDVK
jgi:hypothetical protein